MQGQMNFKKYAVLSIALVAVMGMALAFSLLIARPAAAVGPNTAEGGYPVDTITVNGFGDVYGAPDVAYVQLGMDVTNENLGVAVSQVDEGIQAVLAGLTDAGIAKEDMQTVDYSVWSDEQFNPDTGMPSGTRIYHVSNIVRVTVRDTSKVQAVLDAGISAGANTVRGLSFGIDDTTGLEQEARLEAIDDARIRAGQIAEAVGASLGDVIIVNEGSTYSPVAPVAMAVGKGGGGIEEGQLAVQVQLQVTFSIVR